MSKDYGTVIPGHENPYKQEKIPTITHQHRLQVPRDSDSKWVGVKVYEKKPHVARIWAQNLNGIRYKKTFSSFADTLIAMNRYDVQFFSFSETNLNASNSHIRDEMDAVTQMVMPASRMMLTSTKTSHHSETYQCGGNLSLAHGLLSARYASSGTDKYGRFHWMQFFGHNSHLRIYNIYNPVTHSDNESCDGSVWMQHRLALQSEKIEKKPNTHLFETLMEMFREDIKKIDK